MLCESSRRMGRLEDITFLEHRADACHSGALGLCGRGCTILTFVGQSPATIDMLAIRQYDSACVVDTSASCVCRVKPHSVLSYQVGRSKGALIRLL
jgi:hypothetical protein